MHDKALAKIDPEMFIGAIVHDENIATHGRLLGSQAFYRPSGGNGRNCWRGGASRQPVHAPKTQWASLLARPLTGDGQVGICSRTPRKPIMGISIENEARRSFFACRSIGRK